jgi:hypothetical protein
MADDNGKGTEVLVPPSEMWAMRFAACMEQIEKTAKDSLYIGSCRSGFGLMYGLEFFGTLTQMYHDLNGEHPKVIATLPRYEGDAYITTDAELDGFLDRQGGWQAGIAVPITDPHYLEVAKGHAQRWAGSTRHAKEWF